MQLAHTLANGNISIHVSARETTYQMVQYIPVIYHFNPRLRKGDDSLASIFPISRDWISIHVSARETTFYKSTIYNSFSISIHVSARETTKTGSNLDCRDLYISIHVSARETTCIDKILLVFIRISIHVSARETTLIPLSYFNYINISIHVSARETTQQIIKNTL